MRSLAQLKWIGASTFYALTSFSIVAVNKSVLSIYGFPSVQFLTLVQLIVTATVLQTLKFFRVVTYPALSVTSIRNVMPLPLIHLANLVVGLGSTQSLSIPMFQVLRRFTVLFVMIGEIVILRKKFAMITMATVFAMLFGVIIAFIGDLAYDRYGYTMVLLNDMFTAAYCIYVKKINDANLLGKFGMMYYNSVLAIPFSAFALALSGEYHSVKLFAGWLDPWFNFQFALCNILGFILMYSAILCTAVCGALTYNVVGVLKSTAVTYAGMSFGGDYIFSWLNFFGITVSAMGGVVYSAITFSSVEQNNRPNKKGHVLVA